MHIVLTPGAGYSLRKHAWSGEVGRDYKSVYKANKWSVWFIKREVHAPLDLGFLFYCWSSCL